jgi:lysophospholipase L1-like esterase
MFAASAIALLLAQAAPNTAPHPPVAASKVILVGDSTTAVTGGWGASFCAWHVVHELACVNLARGGRSSHSYRSEGSWDLVLAEARVPGFQRTWVLIQFGHNDQPGKPGRSTDLATEFPANLRRYVTEARAAGAIPVLVTPLTRRIFTERRLTNDLCPWADAVRRLAAELEVPLVDLNRHSAAVVEALGPTAALALAEAPASAATAAATLGGDSPAAPPAPPAMTAGVGDPRATFDHTHLGREGADLFARLVAADLMAAVPTLRPLLVP